MRGWLFSLCLSTATLLLPLAASAQTVRISDFDDLSLGTWLGSGDLSNEDTVCVYNLGVSTYRVRATGNGTGGAFTMSGPSSPLSYEVEFKSGVGSFVGMTSGNWGNFSGADTASDTCNGGTNATIKIIAREAALSGAQSGSYSGTLTILLETN